LNRFPARRTDGIVATKEQEEEEKAMSSLRPARLLVTTLLFGLVCGCMPTVDLSGTYTPIDYPWSGLAKIDIATVFPAPWFSGTFTVYNLLEYTEVPILGIINDQNQIEFAPQNEDPPISGLCVCRGFDDGSSIFTGTGEIAGDGLSDRLACSTYLGQPFDPPAEVYRIDWPPTE
jgi:hypothetical protein